MNKTPVTQVMIIRNAYPARNEQGHGLYSVTVYRGDIQRQYLVHVYNAGIGMLDTLSYRHDGVCAHTIAQGEYPFMSYDRIP